MLIKVKNKGVLILDDFIFKCSIGKNGIKANKKEGDKSTPSGTFTIGKLYYRADRERKPITKISTKVIKKNMGWCDDPKSKKYNQLIYLPFISSYEKLFLKKNIYDIILVLNYNMSPIKKNKGSAIFIHIAKNNYKKTEGCIAVKKINLLKIIKDIKKNTKIKILSQI